MLDPKKSFYTINELVDAGFGCRTTIWRKIHNDGLPACKIGPRVLIPREEFEAYMNERRIKSRA